MLPAQQCKEAARDATLQQYRKMVEHGNRAQQVNGFHSPTNLHLPSEQGVPIYTSYLQRKSGLPNEVMVVEFAAEGLDAYGPKAKAALPAMVRLIDDAEPSGEKETFVSSYWCTITSALVKISPGDPEVFQVLLRALERGGR